MRFKRATMQSQILRETRGNSRNQKSNHRGGLVKDLQAQKKHYSFEPMSRWCFFISLEFRLKVERSTMRTAKTLCNGYINFTQYLSNVLKSHGRVDVVFNDILLKKFEGFDFSPVLRIYKSQRHSANSEVPQGYNLCPPPLFIFINDIYSVIDSKNVIFADDMKIFKKNERFSNCFSLQNDLKNIDEWFLNVKSLLMLESSIMKNIPKYKN